MNINEVTIYPDKLGSIKGERALWRAVITQALMDAGSRSAKREMRMEKAWAIAWLAGNSEDFCKVCSLAELDQNYVKERAKNAIRNGCIWRADSAVIRSKAKIKKLISTKRKQKVLRKSIKANSGNFQNNIIKKQHNL